MVNVANLVSALGNEGQEFSILKQNDTWCEIVHTKTGTVLNLHNSHSQKGKIACGVSKINGRDSDGAYSYPYDGTARDEKIETTSICFSETKPVGQQARDIINRLLPDAIRYYALGKKQYTEHKQYMDNAIYNAGKLTAIHCDALEVRPNKDNPRSISFYTRDGSSTSGNWPAGYGDAQIGSDVTLKLSVPANVAVELVKLWAKLTQQILDKRKEEQKPALKLDGTLRYALEQHLESLGLFPNEAVASVDLLANDDDATIKRLNAAAKDYSQATLATFILRANQSASTYLDKTNPDHLSLPILEQELNRKTA